jgi:sugar lactone lactonase YvrE
MTSWWAGVVVALTAVGIACVPRRKRGVACASAVLLFTVAAAPAAFGGFTADHAAHPRPAPAVTVDAETMDVPANPRCEWTNADNSTSVKLTWSGVASWQATDIDRSTNGGAFGNLTVTGAGVTTYTDSAANSPTSNTYRYELSTEANTWVGAASPTNPTSTSCKYALGELANAEPSAKLYNPIGVDVDSTGNVYIADTTNNKIRKITASTGVISTLAGTGNLGNAGDGGAATSAELAVPFGVAVDGNGNVFVADSGNHAVRVVWAGGTDNYGINTNYGGSHPIAGNIYTIAGHPFTAGTATEGNAAYGEQINTPIDLAIDGHGSVFVSAAGNHRIYMVSARPDDTAQFALADTDRARIYTIAGNGTAGYLGEDVAANTTRIDTGGIDVDAAGNVYLAATLSNRIRVVLAANSAALDSSGSTMGNIYDVAGTGSACGGYTDSGCGDGGDAKSATLAQPKRLDVDAWGNVLVSDTGTKHVRVVFNDVNDPPGHYGITSPLRYEIHTIAGTGSGAYSGNGYPAKGTGAANIDDPAGIAADPTAAGDVYVLDQARYVLRSIDTVDNLVFTKAGQADTSGSTGDGSVAAGWEIPTPYHGAFDAAGNYYWADWLDHRIRKWVAATGDVATVVGTGAAGDSGNGTESLLADIEQPTSVAFDGDGNLYFTDYGNKKVKMVPAADGTYFGIGMTANRVYTVAGDGTGCTVSPCGDGGAAASAQISGPVDVAITSGGDLIVSDQGTCTIRVVAEQAGTYFGQAIGANDIDRVAGTYGVACASTGDGGAGRSATLNVNDGIALDGSGNLYIAETAGNRVRTLTSGGAISTFAGTGACSSTGDGGAATAATFCVPYDVAWNPSNSSLYVTDTNANKIRCVSTTAAASCGQSAPTAGNMYLLAGGGSASPGYGGAARGGTLVTPIGVDIDPGGDVVVLSAVGNTDPRIVYGPDP